MRPKISKTTPCKGALAAAGVRAGQLDASGNSGVHFQYSEIVRAPGLAGRYYRKGRGNPSAGASLAQMASRASVVARAKTPEKISFVVASIEAINPLPNDRLTTRPLLFSLRYRRLSPKSPFSLRARPFRARKEDVHATGPVIAPQRARENRPPSCADRRDRCRQPAAGRRVVFPAANSRTRISRINSRPFRVSASVVPPGSAGAAGRVPCHASSFIS